MKRFWLAVALMAVAGLAWLLWPRGETELRASLVAQAAPSGAEGFARAAPGREISFPADLGPHDDYQTEWWYYTGNLQSPGGEHFGYQLTFFRRALTPPDQRAARSSEWAAGQVYMAHFALTDVAGGKHVSFEKLARGAGGIAGAQADPYRVWLEEWSVDGDILRAAAGGVSIELRLADLKGPVLQGDSGYSRKGPEPGNASYYVSQTRLASEGTVTTPRGSFAVTGLSWMDHEWSTSALGPEQTGWDWFSIQLDDETELMVFQLRRVDGSIDAFSSGTLIAADGVTTSLGPADFTLRPQGAWRSPRSGGEYPAGWTLEVPSAALSITVTPHLADQEMDVSYVYWEGAVRVEGTRGGRPVAGHGYVELTGYAGSMQGEF